MYLYNSITGLVFEMDNKTMLYHEKGYKQVIGEKILAKTIYVKLHITIKVLNIEPTSVSSHKTLIVHKIP